MTDAIDTTAARLEMNASLYPFDPSLDAAADLIEQGPQAWANLHPKLLDLGSLHKDMRDSYRAAVAAGVIPDDRGPRFHHDRGVTR